jgi:hypothetical protein
MRHRFLVPISCFALASFTCQAEWQHGAPTDSSAELMHDAVDPLSPAEHERVSRALTAICPPSITPYPPNARSGDSIEVDYETGDRLTERDVAQILHVAAAAGVHEPLRIRFKRSGRRWSEVHILNSVEEDSSTRIRTQEWLRITHPNWQPNWPNVDQLLDGGWESASPAWATTHTSFFRSGDALWEFQLDSDISYAVALDLYRALGEGEFQVGKAVELPTRALMFQPGILGTIQSMGSVRRRILRRNSEYGPGWNWEIALSHSTGGWAGYSLLLARRHGVWTIVYVEPWSR